MSTYITTKYRLYYLIFPAMYRRGVFRDSAASTLRNVLCIGISVWYKICFAESGMEKRPCVFSCTKCSTLSASKIATIIKSLSACKTISRHKGKDSWRREPLDMRYLCEQCERIPQCGRVIIMYLFHFFLATPHFISADSMRRRLQRVFKKLSRPTLLKLCTFGHNTFNPAASVPWLEVEKRDKRYSVEKLFLSHDKDIIGCGASTNIEHKTILCILYLEGSRYSCYLFIQV